MVEMTHEQLENKIRSMIKLTDLEKENEILKKEKSDLVKKLLFKPEEAEEAEEENYVGGVLG